MAQIRITKQFTFEMAHVLKDYDGPCRNIHGHSYRLDVTLIGTPNTDTNSPKLGMVIDYKDVKKIIKENILNEYDHSLVICDRHDKESIEHLEKSFGKVVIVPFQPTNENLLIEMADKIIRYLPQGIALHKLKLRETDSAYAEWYAEDN